MLSATMLSPFPTSPWQLEQTTSKRWRPRLSSSAVMGTGTSATGPPSGISPVVMKGWPTIRSRGTVPSGGVRIERPSAKRLLAA
jgi:hypothetical protein